jgi:hypothetical protein
MKNLFASLLLFTLVTAFVPQQLQYVYIDKDPKETYYHKEKSCSSEGENEKGHHKMLKVTLDDAINKYKKQPCPLCYKKQE